MARDSSVEGFSKWRAFFWPVHRHELKKLIPMLCIFFLLFFDYNTLRCLKDTLVVTAKGSGAEVIPFIKVWVMFPMSIVLTWIFIKLSNKFQREYVFYIILSAFICFFISFALFLYPYREQLHCHQFANQLSNWLPQGCWGFIQMLRYWSFTLFYVISELWGNIIIFLLFWGFANQSTKIHEAKRFYGLFGVGINISGIAAGQCSILATKWSQYFQKGTTSIANWETSLLWLLSIVVGTALIAMALFYYLNRLLQRNPTLTEQSVSAKKKTKPQFSMRENIRYLFSSRYMLCLVLIVVTYNIVINLVEIMWKHSLRELYPDPTLYNLFMNKVTIWTGISATLASFFISGNSLRIFGWTKTALITPIILSLTSVGFFLSFFLKTSSFMPETLGSLSLLQWVVFFGTLQNCCSRAAKYTVFDETKEIAFIPLSYEEQVKGKAAVDGICTRLGKSGGSIIYQGLFLFCSTIAASAPYVSIILISMLGIWIAAARDLGKQFQSRTEEAKQLENETLVSVSS